MRWKCAPASPWNGALHKPVRLLVCFRRLQTYAGAADKVMTVQSWMEEAPWTFCPLSRACALTQVCFAMAVWRKRDQSSHRTPQHTKVVATVCSLGEWSSECWCLGDMHSPERGHRAFIVTRGANHAVSSPLKSSTAARLLAVLTLPFSSMNSHKYAKV